MRDAIALAQLSTLCLAVLTSCGGAGSDPQGAALSNPALSAGGVTTAREPADPVPLRACAAPVNVPAALAVPAGQRVTAAAFAQGVQIYTCQPQPSPSEGFAWTLKAPDAHLVDLSGEVQAIHYAGPTWESALDGSKVVGAVVARAAAPSADAIPWLLLRAAEASGSGALGRVSFIHRLSTSGGVAPASGCGASTAGAEVRVPYSAIYYFYTSDRGAGCR